MNKNIVLRETRGPVAVITMNNPESANAMDQQMGPSLVRALEEVRLDPAVKACVLTGAGGVFCAGGNIRKAHEHLLENPGSGAGVVFEQYTKWVSRAVSAMCGMEKCFISAVVGSSSGAGLAWMAASDLVVVSNRSKLVPGFLGVGLVPAAGLTVALARRLGHLAAGEMLLLNREFSPAQAVQMGLADITAPPEEVPALALELAEAAAAGPGRALAATKRLLNRAMRPDLIERLEDERRRVISAADDPEFKTRVGRFFS